MTVSQFSLKQWRQIRDLTQEEVAKHLEISSETLRKWENDIKSIPLGRLMSILELYDIKLDQVKTESAS